MKRKIAICLAMLMLWMPYSAVKAMPEVSSHSACVIDIDTGRILAAKNENEKSEPASITKIMTGILAIENNKDLDQTITVSATAEAEEGSSMYLLKGDKLSLRTALYGTMLRSGNDAAVAVAECTAGRTERNL